MNHFELGGVSKLFYFVTTKGRVNIRLGCLIHSKLNKFPRLDRGSLLKDWSRYKKALFHESYF